MADYTPAELRAVLEDLPISRGDTLFSHSNLGFFGRPYGVGSSDEVCRLFVESVIERIGPEGTLVVPTFTYSFPKGEVFDPDATASDMGMFSEWVRRHAEAQRSLDPCYSVAAIGGAATGLTADTPENSFGRGSFFDRFYHAGGKVLNFNFDAGSTFVHYVERCLDVPYRFDKTFTGRILVRGEGRAERCTIWVRYKSDDALVAAFEPFDRIARQKGLFETRPLGRGEVGVISAKDTFNLIADTLSTRPLFLTRAEVLAGR